MKFLYIENIWVTSKAPSLHMKTKIKVEDRYKIIIR